MNSPSTAERPQDASRANCASTAQRPKGASTGLWLWLLLGALSVQLLCSCDRPQVVQGGVTAYDRSSQVVVLRDELPPHPSVAISLAGAELGAEPAAGDTVRVAYREQGGRLTALRLANISRQAEIGGKPSGKKTR